MSLFSFVTCFTEIMVTLLCFSCPNQQGFTANMKPGGSLDLLNMFIGGKLMLQSMQISYPLAFHGCCSSLGYQTF